jgi:uncharacterized cupin superfamily protein
MTESHPRLAVTELTIEPGQGATDYHFEHGNEHWALVVEGRLTIRDPDGDHMLSPGDVVCFPRGPGAHIS